MILLIIGSKHSKKKRRAIKKKKGVIGNLSTLIKEGDDEYNPNLS